MPWLKNWSGHPRGEASFGKGASHPTPLRRNGPSDAPELHGRKLPAWPHSRLLRRATRLTASLLSSGGKAEPRPDARQPGSGPADLLGHPGSRPRLLHSHLLSP